MKKIIIIFFILFTSTLHAQLTNSSLYTWESVLTPGIPLSRQTNAIADFYKFLVTYNNFYLDITEAGHSNNNIYNAFPGTTITLPHYINNVGSTNEIEGVNLKLGNVPTGVIIEILNGGGTPITNTTPINTGTSFLYNTRITISNNFIGNSFTFNITNTGSTNGSPFPYQVVVKHTVNVTHQNVLVHQATDGIHTINVFDGSQPLGNLKTKIFIQIRGNVTDKNSVKLYYDMNTTPDGSAPDGSVNKNRVIQLTQEGDFWVGYILETDPEIKAGNIVNFIVSVDNHLYYNNNQPWRYIVKEYAVQEESENTISVNNKFNPTLGEVYNIIYKLNRNSFINISIYNTRGELVRILKNEHVGIGRHSEEWNGRNDNGSIVAIGLYLVNIQTSEYGDIRKVLLIK